MSKRSQPKRGANGGKTGASMNHHTTTGGLMNPILYRMAINLPPEERKKPVEKAHSSKLTNEEILNIRVLYERDQLPPRAIHNMYPQITMRYLTQILHYQVATKLIPKF